MNERAGFGDLCTVQRQLELMYKNGATSKPLSELYVDQNYSVLFDKYELPEIQMVTDGNCFIVPAKRVSEATSQQYHIWVAVASDGKNIIHGFSYPYVEIRPDYWLLKVIIPVSSLKSMPFEMSVVYFQQASRINIVQNRSFNPDHTVAESIGIEPYTGGIPLPFEGKDPVIISKQIITPILKAIGVNTSEFIKI